MPSSNIKTILILFFSLFTFFVTAYPVTKSDPSATFYTIDPDVHYLSNSFLYIKTGQIQYNGHPGTPTIILHSYTLFPLRIYAKLIAKIPFSLWVFQNAEFVYHYIRIFQSLLLSVSVGIFLLSISKMTKSTASIIFAWMALFVYSTMPQTGSSIVPETTSFFIISVWFLIFSSSIKKVFQLSTQTILLIISGVALANKFTNVTLVFVVLTLVLLTPKLKLKNRIINLLKSVFLTVLTFVISTWPIRATYPNVFRWVSILASTAGTHGSGKKTIFDTSSYLTSVNSLVHNEIWPISIMFLTILVLIFLLTTHRIKIRNPIVTLAFIAFTGTVVFAKYPLSHYQLVNYVSIIFVASFVLSYLPNLLVITLPLLLLPMVLINLTNYYQSVFQAMSKTIQFEKYIIDHPSKKGTLWEWGRTKDFSYLWSRDWASGMFDEELKKYRPNLLAITSDLEQIKVDNRHLVNVFDVCWDKFYIQQAVAPLFLKKYNDRQFKYTPIPNTDNMAVIESNHCVLD